MEKKTYKIAITGPECTGKSLLAEELARHYHTVWVPEYAREYIGKLKRAYTQKDILTIAKGQLRSERKLEKLATDFLFCDTELIVTKIWSEVKYKSCDPWILRKVEENKYDLFLLSYIDLPWEDDPQREHPHLREYLFNLYFEELTERNYPFCVVSGTGERRIHNALQSIEGFLKQNAGTSGKK